MKFEKIFGLFVIIIFMLLPGATSKAYEDTICRSFSEKEIDFIKTSQNPKLLTGAGLIEQYNSVGKEFLELASRIESPKGLGTFSLIHLEIGESPQKPSTRENILKLLHDDEDNAQSYYLNAILQAETAGEKEAISQIKKGNAKLFKTYLKQRFEAVVDAATSAKYNGIQARRCAFDRSFVAHTYVKLRRLCLKLGQSNGQEAKDACFRMGENLEKGSLTLVEQMISRGIQFDSAADTAIKKKLELKHTRNASIECNADVPEDVVPEDVELQFYEIFLKSGEPAAQEFMSNYMKQKTKNIVK